ncbi:hypothetical protein D9M73_276310 [compost metagenome]
MLHLNRRGRETNIVLDELALIKLSAYGGRRRKNTNFSNLAVLNKMNRRFNNTNHFGLGALL